MKDTDPKEKDPKKEEPIKVTESIKACLTCLALLLLIAGGIFSIVGYFIFGRNYISNFSYIVHNDMEKPTILAARGQRVAFDIQLGSTWQGDTAWVSPTGINLNLQGIHTSLQIVGPEQPTWHYPFTQTVKVGDSVQREASGVVTIPTSIGSPEQRLITGEIVGMVLMPGQFGDIEKDIYIPIQMQILPDSNYRWSSWQTPFYIITAINTLLLLWALTHLSISHIKKDKNGEDSMELKQPVQKWSSELPGAIMGAGLFGGVLLYIISYDNAFFLFFDNFTDIGFSILLFTILLGIILWLILSDEHYDTKKRPSRNRRAAGVKISEA